MMDVILWTVGLIIAIGLVIWLMRRFTDLFPFAPRNMAARQARIAEELEKARGHEQRLASVRDEIDRDLAAARTQAAEIVARAREEAATGADEVRQRGARDADALVERARRDIEVERDQAIEQIRRESARVVVDAAGAVLARAIDQPRHQQLIEGSLGRVDPPKERA
jgi:F-type H+-transporting ATPase subunit b